MIRYRSELWLGLLCLCVVAGCFKSSTTQASSESSSKSSSSPFESSSASSSPAEEGGDSAYQRDVRDYTARFAASEGDVQAFQRDLGAIAEGHGVTDWQGEQATYLAIGQGLAQAGLDRSRFHRLAARLADDDRRHLALVRAGYERYPAP